MEIKAKNNYLRISPRKVRAICDLIRDMEIGEAEIQLENSTKKAARPVKKLLKSAIANAENNFEIDKKNLQIKEITADKGPTMKRWQPRAFGRTTPIDKRTTHLTITLAPKKEVKPVGKKEEGEEEQIQTKKEAPTQKKSFSNKPQDQKQQKGPQKEKKDSFFRRKSI